MKSCSPVGPPVHSVLEYAVPAKPTKAVWDALTREKKDCAEVPVLELVMVVRSGPLVLRVCDCVAPVNVFDAFSSGTFADNDPSASVPVTSALKLTAPNVGAPAALPCRSVVVVPSDPSDVGATAAPPPSTILFARSAEELASDVDESKYGMPPEVPVAAIASVPVVVTGEPVTLKIAGAVSATL